jgi:nucleosome binding factor SPN SPT16 subunit
MTKLSYRGTPEQAVSLVNEMRNKLADAKRKSKHSSLEDAMNDLVDDISNLQYLVTNGTKQSLLDACFEFAYIEEQLTIVRLLVEKQRTKMENK